MIIKEPEVDIPYTEVSFTKELEFNEACIDRMWKSSMFLKGLAFFAAVFGILCAPAYAASLSKLAYLVPWTVLICVLWYLDAYYLRMERMFRKAYDHVRWDRADGSVSDAFNLYAHRFACEVAPIGDVALSITEAPLYLLYIAVLIIGVV